MLKDVHLQDASRVKRTRVGRILGPIGGKMMGRGLSRRQRQSLLKRIGAMWVQGVLEPSMEDGERLALVWQRWSRSKPGAPAETLARPQESILEAFDAAGGRLLISGEFGSGKTTALLELLSALLTRAEQDAPIPIVCNLTSWAIQSLPLEKWLAIEIEEIYQMRRFEPERFSLLLDGLDDVPAEKSVACLQAINTFLHDHEQVSVVVCCNSTQQMYINEIALTQMVVIQPLTMAQIDAYFSTMPALQRAVSEALEADPTLHEAASRPLNIDMLMQIYARRGSEDITARDVAEKIRSLSPEFVKSTVGVYTLHALHTPAERYKPEEYVRGLSWLNQQLWMSQRNEFRLEQIQPYWLIVGGNAWLYRCLMGLLATCAMLIALGFVNTDWHSIDWRIENVIISCIGLIGFAAFYFVFSGRSVRTRRQTNFANSIWLLLGFTSDATQKIGLSTLFSDNTIWIGRIIWVAIVVLVVGVFEWLNRIYDYPHVSLDAKQWLWRARRRAIVAGLLSIVLLSCYGVIMHGLSGLWDGLRLGLFFGLMSSLGLGGDAYVEHYMLRFCLWRARYLPWDAVTLLDNAVGSGLLYRVGSGYVFRNRLLQRYFDDGRS